MIISCFPCVQTAGAKTHVRKSCFVIVLLMEKDSNMEEPNCDIHRHNAGRTSQSLPFSFPSIRNESIPFLEMLMAENISFSCALNIQPHFSQMREDFCLLQGWIQGILETWSTPPLTFESKILLFSKFCPTNAECFHEAWL